MTEDEYWARLHRARQDMMSESFGEDPDSEDLAEGEEDE